MRTTKTGVNLDEVVVLVPAFNEAKVIEATLNKLLTHFKHVVCVDDGSSDDTREQALRTHAEVVSHPINLGQGAALQTAIEYALLNPLYRYFVTYDADGQHSYKDAMNMLEYAHTHDVDIVLGSRFLGFTQDMKTSRKLILKLAILFSNYTTNLKLTDAHNGLRVFTREVAAKLNITMPDMAHASQITHRIAQQKFRYAELPVTISYTNYSMAKGQSTINSINILFDLLLHRATKKW